MTVNKLILPQTELQIITPPTEKEDLQNSSSAQSEELQPTCPYCGSKNVFGMSRVVGYFSIIENWNDSKKAELKRRQQGNYWMSKNEKKTSKTK